MRSIYLQKMSNHKSSKSFFVQAVYGTLKSMEDMEAFLDMLQYTKIGPWYGRMQKLCEKNSRMIKQDKKDSLE